MSSTSGVWNEPLWSILCLSGLNEKFDTENVVKYIKKTCRPWKNITKY